MHNVTRDDFNKRLKILDRGEKFSEDLVLENENKARFLNYEKIIVTTGEKNWRNYLNHGYQLEGVIDTFFNGHPAYLMSFFLTAQRGNSLSSLEANKILRLARLKQASSRQQKEINFVIRDAKPSDQDVIFKIFQRVFSTYPSPIHDPEYLKKVLNNSLFKVCLHEGEVISVASADIDWGNKGAEITDCATLPEFRGYGLMEKLVEGLEKTLKEKNVITLYSLARALSLGITKVFYRQGYAYSGRLVNNCHICGQYEDMNLWVKTI